MMQLQRTPQAPQVPKRELFVCLYLLKHGGNRSLGFAMLHNGKFMSASDCHPTAEAAWQIINGEIPRSGMPPQAAVFVINDLASDGSVLTPQQLADIKLLGFIEHLTSCAGAEVLKYSEERAKSSWDRAEAILSVHAQGPVPATVTFAVSAALTAYNNYRVRAGTAAAQSKPRLVLPGEV